MRDIVVVALAVGVTLAMLAHGSGSTRPLDGWGFGLAAITCLPLLGHRTRPVAVFVACTAASATIEALGYALGPPVGPTVALFYLAADCRTPGRMRQIAGTVVALGAIHVGVAAATTPGFPTVPVLGAIVVWGGAWIIGDQLRQRRQRLTDLRERAERAERETARERRLAVAEERNRIARDLHDSAAHAINVILVQAGAARLLQDKDPGAVSTALFTIEDVARETIADIDQLIHRLRTTDEYAQTAGTVELPTGLASLPTLLERHHAAGMILDMTVDGSPRPLPPAPDQAAYRILQESLTNAARHGTGPVQVKLAYGQRQLDMTISNPTSSDTNGAGTVGYGILGMRERAALLGGSLHAGARNGRFHITARLPYTATAPAQSWGNSS